RRVKLLAEAHDVDAVLAERRADRRRGIRLTRRDLQFDNACNFLCHKNSYAFSTCQYSSSTGVLRPKILTVTFNLPRSGSISSITPLKFRNGPLLILIVSPTAKFTFGFSVSSDAEIWTLMASTSSVGVGTGGSPPTNPITPCVSLMKYHGSSMILLFSYSKTMSTRT